MKVDATLSLEAVRAAILFASNPRLGEDFESQINNHLDIVKALEAINGRRASLIVLIAQGFTFRECAAKLAVSQAVVYRMAYSIFEEIFGESYFARRAA